MLVERNNHGLMWHKAVFACRFWGNHSKPQGNKCTSDRNN